MPQSKIVLPSEQQSKFQSAIKVGILKELHRDKMLTDAQLSYLLSDMEMQKTCAFNKNTCAFSELVV